MIDCTFCQEHLADALLDGDFLEKHPEYTQHLAVCGDCRGEADSLRATFALMDEWQAPEPSAFFDTRLHARLREAQEAAPEGLWERAKAYFQFSTGRHFRPAIAGALALVIVAGGGTLTGLHPWQSSDSVSATVNDLRVLDNNAQALQQMDQLLDDNGTTDDGAAPPTT